MPGTAKMKIQVEVPASMAGTFAKKITELVGPHGNVEVEELEEVERMTPGETLKLYREDAGWTQEELASRLRDRGRRTRQVYVSRMETGEYPISKKMAQDLAKIFSTGHKMFL